MTSQCASCHTHRRHRRRRATSGPTSPTWRAARRWPPLTIPNTPDWLAALDPQPAGDQAGRPHARPGAVGAAQIARTLVAYLELPQVDGDQSSSPAASATSSVLDRMWAERPGLLGWLTTTDHKRIGILYFFTALAFFGAGGVEALLIRTQLIGPNDHLLSPGGLRPGVHDARDHDDLPVRDPDDHGGVRELPIPLMIGARDMAFPRMNASRTGSTWPRGSSCTSRLAQGHAPNAGWFDYVPLASKHLRPRAQHRLLRHGLIFNGIASTAAAINFIVTIFKLRAPGMSHQPDAAVLLRVPGRLLRAAVRAARR